MLISMIHLNDLLNSSIHRRKIIKKRPHWKRLLQLIRSHAIENRPCYNNSREHENIWTKLSKQLEYET